VQNCRPPVGGGPQDCGEVRPLLLINSDMQDGEAGPLEAGREVLMRLQGRDPSAAPLDAGREFDSSAREMGREAGLDASS